MIIDDVLVLVLSLAGIDDSSRFKVLTIWGDVLLFLLMLVKVILQPGHAGVPLLASPERALEGLLVGVSDLMGLEVPFGNKLVPTLVADKGPFPSMRT